MSGYVNARVDIEIESEDIMQGIMDDVTDVARQTIHEEASSIIEICDDEIRDIVREVITNELDIDDEISVAVSAELENYEIMFVRK
jgi:hypothetical protein